MLLDASNFPTRTSRKAEGRSTSRGEARDDWTCISAGSDLFISLAYRQARGKRKRLTLIL